MTRIGDAVPRNSTSESADVVTRDAPASDPRGCSGDRVESDRSMRYQ